MIRMGAIVIFVTGLPLSKTVNVTASAPPLLLTETIWKSRFVNSLVLT